MGPLEKLMDVYGRTESRIRRAYYTLESTLLFPIAWWIHRTRDVEYMSPRLRLSLYHFHAARPLKYTDLERAKRFRANMEYEDLEHQNPPSKEDIN